MSQHNLDRLEQIKKGTQFNHFNIANTDAYFAYNLSKGDFEWLVARASQADSHHRFLSPQIDSLQQYYEDNERLLNRSTSSTVAEIAIEIIDSLRQENKKFREDLRLKTKGRKIK